MFKLNPSFKKRDFGLFFCDQRNRYSDRILDEVPPIYRCEERLQMKHIKLYERYFEDSDHTPIYFMNKKNSQNSPNVHPSWNEKKLGFLEGAKVLRIVISYGESESHEGYETFDDFEAREEVFYIPIQPDQDFNWQIVRKIDEVYPNFLSEDAHILIRESKAKRLETILKKYHVDTYTVEEPKSAIEVVFRVI